MDNTVKENAVPLIMPDAKLRQAQPLRVWMVCNKYGRMLPETMSMVGKRVAIQNFLNDSDETWPVWHKRGWRVKPFSITRGHSNGD